MELPDCTVVKVPIDFAKITHLIDEDIHQLRILRTRYNAMMESQQYVLSSLASKRRRVECSSQEMKMLVEHRLKTSDLIKITSETLKVIQRACTQLETHIMLNKNALKSH